MKSSQWLLLWSMLCSILARLERIDGHPGQAAFSMVIGIVALILAVFFIYQEHKKEQESPKGMDFYFLALSNETAASIFDSFARLQNPGDTVTVQEKDGRRLIICKS